MAQRKTTDQTSLYRDRRSFAKIPDAMDAPTLIAIQTDSFEFFSRARAWRKRSRISAPSRTTPRTCAWSSVATSSERAEVHRGRVQGEGRLHQAPLFVEIRFHQPRDRRDQGEQDAFMGDFPLMTPPRHRSSSTARSASSSPAGALPWRVLRLRERDKASGQDAVQREGHPQPRRVA